MYIIVGRTALNKATGLNHKTNDVDVLMDFQPSILPKGDCHFMPTEILKEFSTQPDESKYGGSYADLDSLYTLKLSHAEYNIHWWKTVQDLMYMRKLGAKKKPELLRLLKEHWKGVHGDKSFLNLGRSAKEFFDDFVPKEHVHDWLHEVVAWPNRPIYTMCLKDGQEVQTDWKKFEAMSLENQVKMLQEEICVIATERWLTKGTVSCYLRAYQLALQKTVTNLTKGRTSMFILENLEHFLKVPKSWKPNLIKYNVMKEKAMKKIEWLDEYLALGGEDEDGESYSESELAEYLAEGLQWVGEDSPVRKWLEAHKYEHISQEGGGEGGGESCEAIFKLDDKFYKASYGYYSYEGFDYDEFFSDLEEVFPKQKTVTVYE